MTSSLVGSEMCIRDRVRRNHCLNGRISDEKACTATTASSSMPKNFLACLLYTSDAADDMSV
eukprot:4721861-Prorocentrum_lima.AAC.1